MNSLARIVAEDVLVFAYCGGDEIEEDFAVEQLERISAQLRAAGSAAVKTFIDEVKLMEGEARTQGDGERAEQLATLAENLGIAE